MGAKRDHSVADRWDGSSTVFPIAEAVAEEVDCVVGMSEKIGDEAAIRFAGGFYQALGYGRSVQTAFELGCNKINLAKLDEEAVPKLLVKPGVNAANVTFI